MRPWLLAACCLLTSLLAACDTSVNNKPYVLTVTPSGTVAATGPVTFTGSTTGEAVSWTLSGPGSLSTSAGATVTYLPPANPGLGQSATLTATHRGSTVTVHLTIGPAALPAASIPGLSAAVDVLYDAWDVPHVTCAQTADCLAAQGYLHARDRLFQMDFLRRVAVGRLAELIGPQGLSQDVQLRTLFTTRAGERLQDALFRNMDPATKVQVTSYVAGINAYLAQLKAGRGTLPGEYAQLPYPITAADIPDWTVPDVLAFVRLQQYQLSESLSSESDYGRFAAVYGPGAPLEDLGKLDAWVRAAQPVGEQTHTLSSALPVPLSPGVGGPPPQGPGAGPRGAGRAQLAQARQAMRPHDGAFGSNNWVIDAAHSATGKAMVANDPHLSLQYPPNFYLASLTSTKASDHLDVTGGAFPGTPGAQVGRGQHVGWGVTVVGYDVTDVYLEQAVPAGLCPAGAPLNTAFCVLYKGAGAAVLAFPVSFKVRLGAGDAGLVDAQTLPAAQRPPAVVAVVPHHGPIIQAPDPVTGGAVSVRWTGHEDWTQDLRGFLGLNTAVDVDGAMAALDDYATGAQNFVLADDAGHIAFYPHALVPVRRFADVRVTAPGSLIPPWFPVPGDGTAEWGTGDDADHCAGAGATTPAEACWIPKTALPQAKDPASGFLATANADPLGVSDDNSPLSHPPYLSFEWDDSTAFRHARITERLAALTAAGGTVSLADMEALQADHVSRFGAAFTRYLSAPAFAPVAAAVPAFGAGRALLMQWGTDGYQCTTGLLGTDPLLSPVDPDATNTRDSAACLLFHFFVRNLLQEVFADDLAVADLGVGGGQAVKAMLHMLQPGTPPEAQSFCNDVDASGAVVATHSCQEQVVTALAASYATLAGTISHSESDWRWGRYHTFRPSSQYPLVSVGYMPGPYARPGGAFTVDVGNASLSGTGTTFTFGSSANVRHISVMDADAPVVRMQLPGPERDLATGSVAGPDLLGDWAKNAYFDYAHGDAVKASAAASQRFTP